MMRALPVVASGDQPSSAARSGPEVGAQPASGVIDLRLGWLADKGGAARQRPSQQGGESGSYKWMQNEER